MSEKDRTACRFFFPWPYQPYQCFCENTQRVALQRRLPEDDQWVVPHNLYLTVFSPASVNVMPFDPTRGSDHARAYATKYCSKPEKWWNAPSLAADHHPSRRHSPCPPSPQTPSVLQTHPSPRPQTPTPHPPTPAESSPLPQTPSPSRRPPAPDHRPRRGKGRRGWSAPNGTS